MKLLNPGPVTLTERVRRALIRPDACHREADFVALAADVRARLAAVYPEAATTHQAILLTASGTGAVEAMLGSLLTKDDRCLVAANGVYGERAAAIVTAQGKNFSVVRGEWTAPLDIQEIARQLDGTFTHVFAVHHETTTGRLNDLDALGRLCRDRNVPLLLDAVSSFAGEALRFSAWNLLACAATANKCLHSAPGLAFVLVDRAALARPSGAPSVYLDLHRYAAAGFPFTPAVPALYALDEALRELDDDGGVVARHARYRDLSTQLRQGIARPGHRAVFARIGVCVDADVVPHARRARLRDLARSAQRVRLRHLCRTRSIGRRAVPDRRHGRRCIGGYREARSPHRRLFNQPELILMNLPILPNAPLAAPSLPITPRLVELKAKIFCHGLRVPDDIWRDITDDNHYKHKRAGVSQGRFFRLRDGASTTTVNAPVLEPFVQKSPLHLMREKGGYRIYENETALTECEPFPWPKWYGQTTSTGTPMPLVVSAHSATSLYTAIYQGGCDYFHGGQECQFCSMKIDNKTEWRKIEPIIEVAQAALAENPAAEMSFGGGTRLTPDKGAKHDIAAVAAFKKAVAMPVCVEMAPPDTNDWLDALKDAGCESLMLNLEIWDREARERYMPGKSKITRERYLEALAYAVKLFGVHQVSSQVLIGLEPIDSTLEGMAALADVGAIPLPTVFRPLRNTTLVQHATPQVEDVLRVFAANLAILKERNLLAEHTRAGCALCGACSSHR